MKDERMKTITEVSPAPSDQHYQMIEGNHVETGLSRMATQYYNSTDSLGPKQHQAKNSTFRLVDNASKSESPMKGGFAPHVAKNKKS